MCGCHGPVWDEDDVRLVTSKTIGVERNEEDRSQWKVGEWGWYRWRMIRLNGQDPDLRQRRLDTERGGVALSDLLLLRMTRW